MWIAVVLAGGRGSRMGGRHKPGIVLGGTTLLARAVSAVRGAGRIVVVGPEQPVDVPVRWTVEQPPRGGPVAALAAGLAVAGDAPDEVVLLAADLAAVTTNTIDRLRDALGDHDGAVLRDTEGHRQWLLSVWRFDTLCAAMPPDPAGRSLRAMLSGLDVAEVPELPGESVDVDTADDLAAAENSIHRPQHGAEDSP